MSKTSKVKDLFYDYTVGAKPFIKWAGGKSQLIKSLKEYYPKELETGKITKYFEPFVGSGAVFFNVIQNYRNVLEAYLSDINDELILVYKVIKNHVEELTKELSKMQIIFNEKNADERIEHYYKIRELYNKNKQKQISSKSKEISIERVSHTLFLNKTCYNGLFRVNSKGQFNTPYGRYKNPRIVDRSNLLNCSKVLQKAKISCSSYEKILKHVNKNSFVYLDPPYRPLTETSNFTAYTKFTFGDDEQKKLADFIKQLDSKGAKVMLSNSDPKNIDKKDNFFEKLYRSNRFNIQRVKAKRMINSKGESRGAIDELIIRNYE